ncbi:MAG: helix-turn-helix transcriptional regulator [Clostridiales bacterium]|nr:helix-turn-helix transcriptional regulator [Clostridiales bacterium]
MDALPGDPATPQMRLVRTGDALFLRTMMLGIDRGERQHRPLYQARISNHIEAMLIAVSRAAAECRACMDYASDRLYEPRALLMGQSAQPWAVGETAARINLGASRFSALYKRQFGVSPMSDLIGIRINAARRMLRATGKSMRDVACECDFQNEFYFSRAFRARVGLSPNQYRRHFQ